MSKYLDFNRIKPLSQSEYDGVLLCSTNFNIQFGTYLCFCRLSKSISDDTT